MPPQSLGKVKDLHSPPLPPGEPCDEGDLKPRFLPTGKKSPSSPASFSGPSAPLPAPTHTAVQEEEMDAQLETLTPSSFPSRARCGYLKRRPQAGPARP